MTLKNKLVSKGVIGILLTLLAAGSQGNLRAQEKERLLFEEIPVVITASLKEQPITEAPTTITVLTAEDIRYSGATTIPDVLRQVAGVDVMAISARDQQVGVRGFIAPMNNKLLVLVDGRTVYTDIYALVAWDSFPVSLEEIERVEVVKSPASTIYGANAFSGVINIISKSPQQLQGTTLHVAVGNPDTLIGTFIHAGKVGSKTRYKVSAQWDQTGEWQERRAGEKPAEAIRFNALVEHLIGKKIKLVLAAGRGQIKNRKLLTGEELGPSLVYGRMDHLQLDLQYGNLKFRTFFKSEVPKFNLLSTGESQNWDLTTFNAEILHQLKWGKTHSLLWGFNYRHNRLEQNPFILQDQRQDLWALFLEDEIKMTEKWRLTLGGRYDWHPLVKGNFSPRGNLYYSPSPRHIFRLSVAKAFRNPSFVDSYLHIENPFTFTLPPPLPPLVIPYTVIYKGNQDLKPEDITAYEIGYQSTCSSHCRLNLNFFYHRYRRFFLLKGAVTYYEANEIFPGFPGEVVPKRIVYSSENRGKAWGIGGEAGLDFFIKKGITGFLNYSFQQITDSEDDPATAAINEKNRIRTDSPKHKFNAGLRFIFKNGISLNLLAHWVDASQRLIRSRDGIYYLAPLDDSWLVNTRVGYTFWQKKIEVALAVFNLFNDTHFEYPADTNALLPNSIRLGRRITFSLGVKF